MGSNENHSRKPELLPLDLICVIGHTTKQEIIKAKKGISMDREIYEYRARILKAMANPSRLMIMDTLSSGEKSVAALQEMIGSDISTVSKHLSVLKSAHIVIDRRSGAQVFYRLAVPCILDFFSCVNMVIQSDAEKSGRVASMIG